MRDKYDEAIEYYKSNEEDIFEHWRSPFDHLPHSALFLPLGPTNEQQSFPDFQGMTCACPSIIKNHEGYVACSGKLYKMVMESNLPVATISKVTGYECEIRIEHLEVFAALQRECDKELGDFLRDHF